MTLDLCTPRNLSSLVCQSVASKSSLEYFTYLVPYKRDWASRFRWPVRTVSSRGKIDIQICARPPNQTTPLYYFMSHYSPKPYCIQLHQRISQIAYRTLLYYTQYALTDYGVFDKQPTLYYLPMESTSAQFCLYQILTQSAHIYKSQNQIFRVVFLLPPAK